MRRLAGGLTCPCSAFFNLSLTSSNYSPRHIPSPFLSGVNNELLISVLPVTREGYLHTPRLPTALGRMISSPVWSDTLSEWLDLALLTHWARIVCWTCLLMRRDSSFTGDFFQTTFFLLIFTLALSSNLTTLAAPRVLFSLITFSISCQNVLLMQLPGAFISSGA